MITSIKGAARLAARTCPAELGSLVSAASPVAVAVAVAGVAPGMVVAGMVVAGMTVPLTVLSGIVVAGT